HHPLHLPSFPTRRSSDLRYDTIRICSTWPAGCSKVGSTHHAMNLGPMTMRKMPAASVSDSAILDHLKKISRSSACLPCACSRVRSEEHTSELQSRFDLVC